MSVRIDFSKDKIAVFYRRWRFQELAISGSTLGDDFRPDSDVDVLVVFQEDAKWSLFDHRKAEEELKQIFGREVDLVEKKAIRNSFRRSLRLFVLCSGHRCGWWPWHVGGDELAVCTEGECYCLQSATCHRRACETFDC